MRRSGSPARALVELEDLADDGGLDTLAEALARLVAAAYRQRLDEATPRDSSHSVRRTGPSPTTEHRRRHRSAKQWLRFGSVLRTEKLNDGRPVMNHLQKKGSGDV